MTPRPVKIVVGYDGSSDCRAAVDWAAREAARTGQPLVVLHVAGYGVAELAPLGLDGTVEKIASAIVAEGVERARQAADGILVEGRHELAHATSGLVAASKDATLLVLGTRAPGDLTGAALGSVVFAVTAHARCPVVVVRADTATGEPPGPDRPVVVGVDGSECSAGAVRFAADMALRWSARLVIVSSYRSVVSQAWTGEALRTLAASGGPARALESGGTVTFDELVRNVGEYAASAAVDEALERHPALIISEQVVEGPPVRSLVQAARGAGLLVVGSRGRGAFAGLALGSVSHGVIHAAPCPVAVVRDHE